MTRTEKEQWEREREREIERERDRERDRDNNNKNLVYSIIGENNKRHKIKAIKMDSVKIKT